LTDTFCKL